jgi:hypothetical protein
MSKKTFAESIKDAEVMSAGLTTNATQIAKRGIDKTFTTTLQTDVKKAIALNNEQEKLKADLKRKTEELDAKLSAINAAVAKARKLVKVEFSQSQWKEFGIEAKH